MQIVTLSQLSLAGSSGIAEAKIPLWWADGNSFSTTNGAAGSYLSDGSTAAGAATASQSKLITLSSNWPSSLSFALEVSLYSSNAVATAYAQLYDITSAATAITGSQTSTTSTTTTVLRSNKFTLSPGHTYGVTPWISQSAYSVYISDASLIIFPS